MNAHALADQLHLARATLGRRRVGGAVVRTAGFNIAAAGAAALTGVVMARVLGPTARGEYVAVIAWFGLLLVIGEVGQSAAVCFHVASDPRRARGYVATARAMMLVTGGVTLAAGLLAAPLVAHGNPALTGAYRLAFGGSALAFLGTSYTYSLQATSLRQWNLIRLSQPALAVLGVLALCTLHRLTLDTGVGVVIVTVTAQLGYAYYWCRRLGLAPGRAEAALVRPLAAYGLTQLAAVTPTAVNAYLDQLVLSQLVPPADLGRYSVAVSIAMIPVPFVSAIGNVAFPKLAAGRSAAADRTRLIRVAVAASAGAAAAILLPLAAIAYWLVPAVFGPAYRGAVPLLWLLTPGGVFLACGQVVGDLLRGLNQTRLVAAAQGIAAVGTVTILIALLPSLGVAAAAIASTIAYGTSLAVMIRRLRAAPGRIAPRHARGPTAPPSAAV